MNQYDILFIDTETGGLDPDTQSILSLGAAYLNAGQIIDTFEMYIREPDIVIDEGSLAIHGIDKSWLIENGLPPRKAVDRLHSFLDSLEPGRNESRFLLGGHNVCFDIAFLKRLYRLSGDDIGRRYSHRFIDTSSILSFLIHAGSLPLKTASSDEAFGYFNILTRKNVRHNALTDAIATAKLYTHLLEIMTGHSSTL